MVVGTVVMATAATAQATARAMAVKAPVTAPGMDLEPETVRIPDLFKKLGLPAGSPNHSWDIEIFILIDAKALYHAFILAQWPIFLCG